MRKLDKRSQIVGKTFEGIKVIEVTDKLKWKARVFKAICRCGNEFEQVGYALKKGQGCGCKINNSKRKTEEHDQERYIKARYQIYKDGAKRRGISFNFPLKAFSFLAAKECHYCGEAPSISTVNKRKTYTYTGYSNGIDRKDNNEGYSLLNCVPCCTVCNMMKKDMNYEDFISHCGKILIRSLEKIIKAKK